MNSYKHIIVVDDDLEDHLILQEYFRESGNADKVGFFENANKALEHLSSITTTELPKLIVLDLNMPILNGTQVLLQLKRDQKLKNIPVIIFSTSENETEKRKSLSLGALDYLVKPTTFDEGQKMVNQFLRYVE